MFTVRRWWDRKGLQVGLLAMVVGGAWMLRQTQGGLLLEVYQGITRPLEMFHSSSNAQEWRRDAKINELNTRIQELETQNNQLKGLVKYIEPQKTFGSGVPARVVGRSADSWWQQVVLNRGQADGINEGDIVKAEGGLVGRVEIVTANASRVLLVSDLKSQVGVNITRSGAKGVLKGDGSADAVLAFYEKVPNVKVGDFVSTSTYSPRYPSGLAVGRVKSLDLKKLPASEAKIELFPPIRSLDWVTVHPKPEKNKELENLNKKPEAEKQQVSKSQKSN
ncbi:MAG: rod shape-determining protein MreC [Calothrix sp. SM1_7_51]|nr:rod shape-determining protein MreC [Calothrix sp. SM1_7_51]